MTKILLMSDTHGYLGNELVRHAQWADEVWHAGDWLNEELYLQLSELKKNIRTVFGNVDGYELRAFMPETLIFYCSGIKVLMVHIGGYPGRYPARIKNILLKEKPDLFICGHSHILKVMRDEQLNLLHMNPGACGISGFHKQRTMLRFEIINSKIQNVELIDLGNRNTI